MTLTHEFPDRHVELVFWRATITRGEPQGLDGQQLKWVECGALGAEKILEADRPFIEKLMLVTTL